MKIILLATAVCLPLLGFTAASSVTKATATQASVVVQEPVAAPATGSYQVDPVHSNALFRILHNRVANFYGRFNQIEGSFDWDGEDLAKAKVVIDVAVSSVDTHDAKRDEHLRSPDFFNERRYPKLHFESSKVEGTADALKVTGTLSLHGIEKEITIPAMFTGYSETQFGTRAGFEAVFSLDRNDFGIETYPDNLGKMVQITISLEGIKS